MNSSNIINNKTTDANTISNPVIKSIPYAFGNAIVIIASITFVMIVIGQRIAINYPESNRGKTAAMNIAKDFSIALSGRDFNKAYNLLTPTAQTYMNTPETLNLNSDVKPTSGTWEGVNENGDVYGEITYSDGVTLKAVTNIEFYKGEFKVSGMEIGTDLEDTRLSFLFCCEKQGPFDWIYLYLK